MRIGSLFSGIGGLELGLEWAGVGHTVWQVEIDPFCRSVLAKHWPDAVRFDDVRTVGRHNLPPVDVICGGYPCQPFSHAGKREGANDERHLWPEFYRILCELRPRFGVLENVPGHLSLGFGDVLADLAEVGYDAEWEVLSACSQNAPHTRERLFCITYPLGQGGEGLVEADYPRSLGSGWLRGPEDLQGLLGSPFVAGPRWPQPLLRGVDDGLSGRMDRLRAIGNAVVPQVAEVVGRRLLEIDAELRGVARG